MLITHTVVHNSVAGLLTRPLVIHIVGRISEEKISLFACELYELLVGF
nr:MAG TPA: hypothetical protein [Caudoviricetes sp.]